MPLLALGHRVALSLLTLMLGGALTLMPVCEAIPYRITDTRQLMEQISNMSFPQNVIILSMDITDFYPNASV